MEVVETAVAVRPVGVEGGVASEDDDTVIVVVAVLVPLELVAVNVYVKVPVAFGVTDVLPEKVDVVRFILLPKIFTEDAFDTVQDNVVEEPRVRVEVVAEKEEMVGVEVAAALIMSCINAKPVEE